MAGQGLPDDTLTKERATLHRHAECTNGRCSLRTLAMTKSSLWVCVTPVGALQFMSDANLWIEAAGGQSSLPPDQQRWWAKALTAVFELNFRSLDQISV